jgi:excisionase family DNA binding protein
MDTHDRCDCLLKITEVKALLSLGRSTIYEYVRDGKLPKPMHIGGASRWRLSDIQEVIDIGFDNAKN